MIATLVTCQRTEPGLSAGLGAKQRDPSRARRFRKGHIQQRSQGDAMDVFPPGWDEKRRAHVRDELDGFYAHLYGLPRDELAYILDTFPIVRRKDEGCDMGISGQSG